MGKESSSSLGESREKDSNCLGNNTVFQEGSDSSHTALRCPCSTANFIPRESVCVWVCSELRNEGSPSAVLMKGSNDC